MRYFAKFCVTTEAQSPLIEKMALVSFLILFWRDLFTGLEMGVAPRDCLKNIFLFRLEVTFKNAISTQYDTRRRGLVGNMDLDMGFNVEYYI